MNWEIVNFGLYSGKTVIRVSRGKSNTYYIAAMGDKFTSQVCTPDAGIAVEETFRCIVDAQRWAEIYEMVAV